MKSVMKSILAVVLGMLSGGVPTILCDTVLEKAGIMNQQHFGDTPFLVILAVIGYRFVWNVVGCYVCARIAPNTPMKHCMIIGVLGTVLSLGATFSMPDAGPMWYGLSVAAISIPCAWIGATLFMNRKTSTASS